MLKRARWVVVLAGFGILLSFLRVFPVAADDGEEMIVAHPMKMYPDSVPHSTNQGTEFLSKDNLSKIKAFYVKNALLGDKIIPAATDSEQGFRIMYAKIIGKKEQKVLELECFERKPGDIVHDALGELMLQAKLGKRSEAEYKALEKRYRNLTSAYYRMIDNGKGGTVSEGEAIYRKVFNRVHGKKKADMSDAEKAEGKSRSQDIKAQMQELKAKGDFAGMMKLAQESKMSPRDTTAGAAAMDDMAKDTWDEWVTCLKDLDAAAYWTRLHYSSGALSPVE